MAAAKEERKFFVTVFYKDKKSSRRIRTLEKEMSAYCINGLDHLITFFITHRELTGYLVGLKLSYDWRGLPWASFRFDDAVRGFTIGEFDIIRHGLRFRFNGMSRKAYIIGDNGKEMKPSQKQAF